LKKIILQYKDIEYLVTESKLGKISICVNETKLNKENGEYERIASNWFECVLSGKILEQHQTKITIIRRGAVLIFEKLIILILSIILVSVGTYNIFLANYRNTTIETLEKEKYEYCKVIAKLEWYAPDSVKYPYRNIIEFAKLQDYK
jgi:hypothetical protein